MFGGLPQANDEASDDNKPSLTTGSLPQENEEARENRALEVGQ